MGSEVPWQLGWPHNICLSNLAWFIHTLIIHNTDISPSKEPLVGQELLLKDVTGDFSKVRTLQELCQLNPPPQ